MARQIVINGESLVYVKGGAHMSGVPIGLRSELGLAEDQITLTFQMSHEGIFNNNFGPQVPVDTIFQAAGCRIQMTLIQYDPYVLDACVAESMVANPGPVDNIQVVGNGDPVSFVGGLLPGIGQPLGGVARLMDSGWRYVSVNITSTQLEQPWVFPKCYLVDEPVTIPLGNECSKTKLTWQAIPYWDPTVQLSPSDSLQLAVPMTPPYGTQAAINDQYGVMSFRYNLDAPTSGAVLFRRNVLDSRTNRWYINPKLLEQED